ncbi:MAG: PDDEXK nuclease domain-containing protein, partial [Thermoguttaceae bacterium]
MTTKARKSKVARSAPIYERIRVILESARAGVARSVNTTQVVANWLIGREIVEELQRGQERAAYGTQLVRDLALRLTADFGRGFSKNNLEHFRDFYLTYPGLCAMDIAHATSGQLQSEEFDKIAHAVRGQWTAMDDPPGKKTARTGMFLEEVRLGLAISDTWQPGRLHPNLSWTHYRTLLRVDTDAARGFYEIEAIQNNWSARELERQINSLLFERLAKSKDKKGLMRLATQGQEISQPADVFKDPVVIEFLGLPESPRLVESVLETALIDNLQTFLLELGKGFAFVARQDRITLDGDHFYIDLVFYHTVLKCFVAIDLKIGKLTHADLGQLQLYVNYYDEQRRTAGDNPTLGLILCTDKNE